MTIPTHTPLAPAEGDDRAPTPRPGVLISGTVGASAITGETYASLAEKIRSGNAYINVHTVTNPNGEIRGQVEAEN